MRLSNSSIGSIVVFAASVLTCAEGLAGDFSIVDPQPGDKILTTAAIPCSGECTFFKEGYTLKLLLQDPIEGQILVDSYQGTSDNLTGAWSHSFQSTQEGGYPAGTYYVEIFADGKQMPDDGVQIFLINK